MGRRRIGVGVLGTVLEWGGRKARRSHWRRPMRRGHRAVRAAGSVRPAVEHRGCNGACVYFSRRGELGGESR